ncbi:hypothetical protein HXA31_11680 [Salipaludibacillus agaradhaerens]|uniref:DUF4944 domain-containing protein n=1 Tax=Salipaludibacillus agaradhaerens TaxID=76935 RepID=A0A9Q4AZ23_SALAG|nr:YdhH/YoaO family protein [Salipaludibacillus agaradhaerens]MCR6095406.1 hypothetical protein [Salipaludibacillus agaradhaerens]MCR6115036.1 hypothetical protein [Salipaludibacillus agaradhaerens]
MWWNKKRFYVFLIVAIILVSWIVYSVSQPPNWRGVSEDGTWETDFKHDVTSPKGFWNGTIYWDGDAPMTLVRVQLTKNDTLIHEWDGNEVIDNEHPFDYLTTTETFDNKEDEYVLKVYWEEQEAKGEDTIVLLPKTKYVVLPNFLN